MESSEEKFFEYLAKGGSIENDEDVTAEPEKADAVSLTGRGKNANKKAEKNMVDEPEGQLTIDVYQTPNDIVIESAIAGIKPEDLDINVSNDSVTIRGERRRESEIRDEDYFYQECYWGRFSRSVILPQEIDPDGATVKFKNGVLILRMPKLNRKKARKLKVKVE